MVTVYVITRQTIKTQTVSAQETNKTLPEALYLVDEQSFKPSINAMSDKILIL